MRGLVGDSGDGLSGGEALGEAEAGAGRVPELFPFPTMAQSKKNYIN